MNKVLAGALFAAVSGLIGCSSASNPATLKTNPAPCPNIVALGDASRLIEFSGDREVIEDVAYTGEITNVAIGCRYKDDKPIDAVVELELAFGRGPQGAAPEKMFKYFVAVTRKDTEIIAKKEFLVPVNFGVENKIVVTTEEIDEIIIPRASAGVAGTNFEIVVGFSLTPKQVIFNRSGKSLKFPNLQ
ncbi:MAG: hypothetical protein DHS20C05_05650 [Hyphococcus sp.]|nr:MAG: hypothetical protein DHS20C05_05650 [Marinicaulis sp.]